jgi:phage terminase large subunit
MPNTLKLSRKQSIALNLLEDPQVVELDYGGAAGGAKSWTVALWMVIQCRQYEGIRIGLGRKELSRLKQTTLVTLVREVHPILGITDKDFRFKGDSNTLIYENGSEIQLFDLAYQPSDPDFDTLGSLNLTHVVIEEVGEIMEKAKEVFGSRKDRFLNQQYGITGKLVMTQNPSQNFTRRQFFNPYQELGGGDYQKWKIGSVFIDDKEMDAYRVFVKSLPIDNIFLSKNYIETLKRLPMKERKRLYEGNWDYADDEDSLFKSDLLDKSEFSGELENEFSNNPQRYIGVDVADKGKDKTIVTLIIDGIAVKQRRLNVPTGEEDAISDLYAKELIKFAQQNGFNAQMAKNIAIEGNGVGVGMRDQMRTKGWKISVYTATSKSRSAGYYNLMLDMDAGKTRIWAGMETAQELRRQLMLHSYDMNDNLQPVVIQKKKIKETLGHSPDESDSFMIANWIRRGGIDSTDPRKNSARIIW